MFYKDITFIIKTFERPELLMRLYNSIREIYIENPIIIIDDSKYPLDAIVFDEKTIYIYTEFDIGLAEGRNRAIKAVETKYFVLLDDDFVITKECNIQKMYQFMEKHSDVTITGGRFYNMGCFVNFGGVLEINNKQELVHNVGMNYGFLDGAEIVDIVENFWIARTSELKDKGLLYDANLKIGFEHEDFFLRLKSNNKKVVLLNDIYIEHQQDTSNKTYNFYRNTRAVKYCNMFFDKHNLSSLNIFLNSKKQLEWNRNSHRSFEVDIELYSSNIKFVEYYLWSLYYNEIASDARQVIFNSLKFLFSKYIYLEEEFSQKEFFGMYVKVLNINTYEERFFYIPNKYSVNKFQKIMGIASTIAKKIFNI